MKTFVLFIAALISISNAIAQFSQDFEGTEASMSSNCWSLSGVYRTSNAQDVITGTGSLYTNPPTNESSTRDIITPALTVTNTNLIVAFNYKVSNRINGNATRTIEVGLLDFANNFTSLTVISLDRNSPVTVLSFNQAFNVTIGLKKIVFRLGGSTGDGNSRLIFDDFFTNASPLYGAGTCNTAPVAVNDVFNGIVGNPVTGNVLTNDSDANGEAMVPSVVTTSVNGVVVLNTDGNFTFTPASGFTGSQTTFTYLLADKGFSPLQSNIATVTINFAPHISLPVKLISFNAKYNKPDVLLTWSTSEEINFSHFVLEMSNDGITFNQTAVVFGAGVSGAQNNYSYSDKNMQARGGILYYRLQSVDLDGKSAFSAVRIIRLGEAKSNMAISTFPNPASTEVRITIPANWQNRKVVYELFNANGQTVKRIENTSSSQTETVDISKLNSGLYIMKVTCAGATSQQKIVKQ